MNNDYEHQWQRRQQALQNAENNVPDDEVFLAMARNAQQRQQHQTLRWIQYAAAASVLIGALIFGWNIQNASTKLPEAQEVSIGGQTVQFLCNSGCSAQDIIISAQNIINQ